MAIEKWRWIQKQDMGPSPRYAFLMAYIDMANVEYMNIVSYKETGWRKEKESE